MGKAGFFILLFATSFSVFAQNKIDAKKVEIGLEFEVYPVGYMIVGTSNIFLKDDLALRFRVGGNFADRGDKSGFNDSEIAKGYGASIGIVKYFPVKGGKIIAGFATDFWFMKTDWIDNSVKGTTTNLVIQPWISSGYLFDFSNKFNAGIILGFGREINTFNKGEQVGQGFMGSISVQTNYKLN
ncbi:MAG: hypothetical protein ABIQ27_04885 [Flavobacterium sp.]|uniref:hypothetical protein n=1 Tax=Flavobacterium sp. TaxID=239 RepID=UPI003264BE37